MKPRKPRKAPRQPVSLGGFRREELPLPYVHYPHHYGIFFTFSQTLASEQFLCECSRPAIANWRELRRVAEADSLPPVGNDRPDATPDFIQTVRVAADSREIDRLSTFAFHRAICHRCNLVPPSMRYCHEMYGVEFIQHFGWYVKQAYLKFGIHLGSMHFLPGITPEEYVSDLSLIRETRLALRDARLWFEIRDQQTRERVRNRLPPSTLGEADYAEIARRQLTLKEATGKARTAERVLSTKIENVVREEFGFRKVGDRWTCETLLLQIVSLLCPGQEIIRHYRPEWLGGLEIDIYIPSQHLAIEYQGQQHFHAIPAWGGEDALRELQTRDARKAAQCKSSGVRLVAIDYTEPLAIDYVRNRILVGASSAT